MNSLLDHWKRGYGLPDTLVIDGHIHIHHLDDAAGFHDIDKPVEQYIRIMDAHGIDAACVLSGGFYRMRCDYRIGNDFLLAVCNRAPERMIPFMCINPNDSEANVLHELQRMRSAGVRCIKLINTYQYDYPGDGPILMMLYAFAVEHRMIVVNHHWNEKEIKRIAEVFPELDFVYGHYIGGFQDEVLRIFPNVHAIVWYYNRLGFLEQGIARVGAKKFMLGSDGFVNCPSVGIGPVVFSSRIDDIQKRMILGLNMARLLDKAGALPAALRRNLRAEPL